MPRKLGYNRAFLLAGPSFLEGLNVTAMPIYEYQCQECGHQLEALQKISDDPLTDCPECSESALQKLVSAASFRLKGGGWYETDFKSGDKKHIAESDSNKPGSGEKGGTGESSAKDSDKKSGAKKEVAGDSKSTSKEKTSTGSSTSSSKSSAGTGASSTA